jgi:hypothetical protein
MAQLRLALDGANAPGVERAAYMFKGALGNFGPSAALALVRDLEALGRAGNLPRAQETFPLLEQAVHKLLSTLSSLPA